MRICFKFQNRTIEELKVTQQQKPHQRDKYLDSIINLSIRFSGNSGYY